MGDSTDENGSNPILGHQIRNDAGNRDSKTPNRIAPGPLEVSDALTGETIFLGANSAPAFFLRRPSKERPSQPPNGASAKTLVKANTLSIFGLDNSSVTYPFVNLWSSGDGSHDDVGSLRNALPSDLEILKSVMGLSQPGDLMFPSQNFSDRV